MYVRLGFAVAVNVDPDVLLVDEVLAVGDEAFAHKCEAKLNQFKLRGQDHRAGQPRPDRGQKVRRRGDLAGRRQGGRPGRSRPMVIDAYRQGVARREDQVGRANGPKPRVAELAAKRGAGATARWRSPAVRLLDEAGPAPRGVRQRPAS